MLRGTRGVDADVGLLGDHPIDLHFDGQMDASLLSVIRSGFVLSGPAELLAEVGGTWADPKPQGVFSLKDGVDRRPSEPCSVSRWRRSAS